MHKTIQDAPSSHEMGRHQLMTNPAHQQAAKSWGPPPSCLCNSYRYTQWQTLQMINKTAQNIKLKILWQYFCGSTISSLPVFMKTRYQTAPSLPEIRLSWLCPELQGAQKALLPATATAEWEGKAVPEEEAGTRRQQGTHPHSYAQAGCASSSGMGVPYPARDSGSLLNYLWRQHTFTNFFIYFHINAHVGI